MRPLRKMLGLGLMRLLCRLQSRTRVTWRTGDIAEAISGDAWRHLTTGEQGNGPVAGERHVVRGVVRGPGLVGLNFGPWPAVVFNAACFRKIVPVADEAKAADAAFLDSLKQARRAEPQRENA